MKNIVIWLIVINVIIFIFQTIYPQTTDGFALVSADLLSRPWIIITSMFLHGDMLHIFYNMFALGLFGFILERIIGSKNFIMLYFAAGIVSGLASSIFYEASIGASGAIFGVLGALAALRPRMTVYVGYIPMPMIIAAGVWAFLDLLGMFAPSGIANAAHLGGLAFGIIVGAYWRKDFKEQYERRKKVRMSDKEIYSWENRFMHHL